MGPSCNELTINLWGQIFTRSMSDPSYLSEIIGSPNSKNKILAITPLAIFTIVCMLLCQSLIILINMCSIIWCKSCKYYVFGQTSVRFHNVPIGWDFPRMGWLAIAKLSYIIWPMLENALKVHIADLKQTLLSLHPLLAWYETQN